MFDFLFGGKKKIELIRELLEQRMMDEGYVEMEFKLQIKQMGNTQLMAVPEATLVTILEAVIKLQKQGLLINQIIAKIEDHRRRIGHDPDEFQHIAQVAKGHDTAGMAVPLYCKYRVDLEHRGIMSEDQFANAMEKAVTTLMHIL